MNKKVIGFIIQSHLSKTYLTQSLDEERYFFMVSIETAKIFKIGDDEMFNLFSKEMHVVKVEVYVDLDSDSGIGLAQAPVIK